MRSGGGSFGSVSVHLGQDWSTHLATYQDHPPILDIDAGSTSVTFTVSGRQVTRAAVEFGAELAAQAALFAAELDRLYRDGHDGSGTTPDGGAA